MNEVSQTKTSATYIVRPSHNPEDYQDKAPYAYMNDLRANAYALASKVYENLKCHAAVTCDTPLTNESNKIVGYKLTVKPFDPKDLPHVVALLQLLHLYNP